MTDINIGAISEALNNKVDLPTPSTPQDAVDYVVEKQDPTSANGYTWYRKYKSGWVEQGGIVSALTGDLYAVRLVTLPIEMENTSYTIITSCTYPGAGDATTTVKVDDSLRTTQTFRVRKNWQSTGGGFHWQVSGMSA